MKSFLTWIKRFFRPPKEERIDLNRRAVVSVGLSGLFGSMLFRSTPLGDAQTYNPALIRPPGSLPEDEFLAKCIKCGECMKVCLTNVLHPTYLEAGLEGMWSPFLNMDVSYCEYQCTLCGQVCPTSAIEEITLIERNPTEPGKKPVKIGQAFFDKNRCLPWALDIPCLVCEEHCPTPTKAIWVKKVEVIGRNGEVIKLQQPRVDPELCIGCGICQDVCPINDRPGIYVTSAGESRNPGNHFLLSSSTNFFESNPAAGGNEDEEAASSDPYGSGSPY